MRRSSWYDFKCFLSPPDDACHNRLNECCVVERAPLVSYCTYNYYNYHITRVGSTRSGIRLNEKSVFGVFFTRHSS